MLSHYFRFGPEGGSLGFWLKQFDLAPTGTPHTGELTFNNCNLAFLLPSTLQALGIQTHGHCPKGTRSGWGQGKNRQWCGLEMGTQGLLGLRESAQFSEDVGVGLHRGQSVIPQTKACAGGRH